MLVELFPRVHRRYTSLAISQWLGHASVTTTHWYATVDLEMQRQALAKARRIRLAGRGEKIHEKVCRCGGRVPIREVCRARSTTATIRADLDVSGTLGTCGASNASNETRRS